MSDPDIRWQRFHNFRKAMQQLTLAVELSRQRPLSELEKLGLIHTFRHSGQVQNFLGESNRSGHIFC